MPTLRLSFRLSVSGEAEPPDVRSQSETGNEDEERKCNDRDRETKNIMNAIALLEFS
jgi:hypothetical protein